MIACGSGFDKIKSKLIVWEIEGQGCSSEEREAAFHLSLVSLALALARPVWSAPRWTTVLRVLRPLHLRPLLTCYRAVAVYPGELLVPRPSATCLYVRPWTSSSQPSTTTCQTVGLKVDLDELWARGQFLDIYSLY